jgi:hypothetical protein
VAKGPIYPDKEYLAESDARTLVDAKTIEKDPKRHKAAIAKAKKLAAEKLQQAQFMRAIAKRKA